MKPVYQTLQYKTWVEELKAVIHKSQINTALTVNHAMLRLYWSIGKSISKKIVTENWGAGVVENLSRDLTKHFPNQKGFSRSNLFSMRKWYEFYSHSNIEEQKVQQLVGQIPWGHNILIITKSDSLEKALFYVKKTIENNWSRAVLTHQIELDFYNRSGRAITNFSKTIPPPKSKFATEILKDPYKFDFLTLSEKMSEKDIELQLVEHVTSFLLELGAGFSFVGRQVPIKIDDEDFYIDLLFYHIKLKCYVVVELKTGKFKAEHTGKLNLYLSAVDSEIKSKNENPTLGLLLCKSKSKVVAEYALRGTTQPIGIAEYEILNSIPSNLKTGLPTIEEIENELTSTLKTKPSSKTSS